MEQIIQLLILSYLTEFLYLTRILCVQINIILCMSILQTHSQLTSLQKKTQRRLRDLYDKLK